MPILQSAVNALGLADTTKDIAQAVNNLINANNAMDVGAAAGELAASLATGVAVHGLIRPAMEGVRLGLAVSGQIWKWEALTKAAGIAGGVSSGILIDYLRDLELGIKVYDWMHPVSNSIGTTPDPLVKTIRYVDPLILDLDGDGLEITPLANGVLFDANGDTIKTGTAWAGADDGMLVWDRNGNGLIDSGQELFGDETILANGKKAAHGFAALSELDTGSVVNGAAVGASDGVFDAKDTQYATLRIWRDLNQDGTSQANELQTLAQTGVNSIQLASTTTNTNYGDAILAQSGTFTRADGSSGQAGSFILAQNNFVRQFTPITVSDAAKALPGLKGSGWVRDLQEAATLNPELIGLVTQAQEAPTRAGYKDAVACAFKESVYDALSMHKLEAANDVVWRMAA